MSSNSDRPDEVYESEPVSEALTLADKTLAPTAGRTTAVSAIAAQMVAAIQARYVMAERHPRDIDRVRTRMLTLCCNPSFAERARYSLPARGDDPKKRIEGFSIKFAEALAREMGNIYDQEIVTRDDDQVRVVNVSVMDLETNGTFSADITVPKTIERKHLRRGEIEISHRTNSSGQTVYTVSAGDAEVEPKIAARASKMRRNLILKLAPEDLLEKCERVIKETALAEAKRAPEEAREKVLAAFASKNISAEDLVAYLGHPIEEITAEEIVDLRAIYAAILDGEATWEEIKLTKSGAEIPPEQTAKVQEIKDRIAQRK